MVGRMTLRTRSIRRLALPCLLALAASAGLGGCAQLGSLLLVKEKRPSLSFVRATVRELSLDRLTLDAVFRLDNPHAVAIDLAKVSYLLEVDGRPLLAGAPPQGLQIAAGGSSDLTFPVTVKFADLAEGLAQALARKVLHWKASGEVGVNTPLGVVGLPLSAEGDLDLPELPRFTLETPVVESLSIVGARLVFPVRLENPNRFPLSAPSLRADVSISGVDVGIARTSSEVPLEGRGGQTLRLGLELSFLEVGAGVARSLSNGEAQLKVDGTLEIGGATVPLTLEKLTKFGRVEKKRAGPGLF